MTTPSTRSAYRLAATQKTQRLSIVSPRRNYCVATSSMQLRRRTIPLFVTEKLKDMQVEIANQFISNTSYSSASYTPLNAIPTTSSEFTTSLEKMAKYYFEQGGKMFRPTIALLMANACNAAAPKGVRENLCK
ncbi:hypothetical protein KIN20_026128 [Parelaphostrongylus tenuis]|uniref:Uncharacterized protein n=1 Tax=Parelaphostrongylus tenuis TaxID=148309 RepID=A0AAD5QUV9_PARTN|nr:hypothetical protein KIN20_026128 [Parelaphostrongylus tenuis]